jgi:hypothetical protein
MESIAENRPGSGEPSCVIRVYVGQDQESFASPEDFRTRVTREALRDFDRITVTTGEDQLCVNLELKELLAWWSLRSGPNAEVTLVVTSTSGATPEDVAAVHRRVVHAVQRGRALKSKREDLVHMIAGLLGAVVVSVATFSAFYLVEASGSALAIAGAAYLVVGIFLYPVTYAWLNRSLEIAPLYQTRIWRAVKFVGPIVVGFIIAGITKWVYG